MSCVVYTCHKVVPLPPGAEERGTVDLRRFSGQIKWLKRLGITFIRMRDLLSWLEGARPIPQRSAVLTFDDAYGCIAEHAFPFLKEEKIPFTVFVIAGFIGRESNLYEDRRGSTDQHLNLDEIETLVQSRLVEIGAHGYEHLDLTKIEAMQLRRELTGSKSYLEETLNMEVPYFAYPFGRTTDAVVREVRQSGYKLAFTTRKMKLVSPNIDMMRVPRVNWSRKETLIKLSKYYLIPFARSAG